MNIAAVEPNERRHVHPVAVALPLTNGVGHDSGAGIGLGGNTEGSQVMLVQGMGGPPPPTLAGTGSASAAGPRVLRRRRLVLAPTA